MAVIDLNTSVNDPKDRGNTASGYTDILVPFGSVDGTSEINYVLAPVDGVVKEVLAVASVTSDGTATYTFDVDNGTESNEIVSAQLYDDDPVLTAETYTSVTLSTTASDLAVSKGDSIIVTVAGGTGAGQGAVLVRIEEQ